MSFGPSPPQYLQSVGSIESGTHWYFWGYVLGDQWVVYRHPKSDLASREKANKENNEGVDDTTAFADVEALTYA